jgi:hypothetical protein
MSIYDHGSVKKQAKGFTPSDSRDVDIPPVGSVRRLFGLLNRPGLRAPTVEEMTENMADSISEDNERIRRGE